MKTIIVKCKAADTLAIDELIEFQSKLKKITKPNLEKLKNSILKKGFIAPIFIWDNAGDKKLLDGHQRLKALLSLRESGYNIPLLPVAYIEADNEADAKEKLLQITSQYGDIDRVGFDEFIDGLDFDGLEDVRLMRKEFKIKNIEIDFDNIDETKINEGQIFSCPKCGFKWQE